MKKRILIIKKVKICFICLLIILIFSTQNTRADDKTSFIKSDSMNLAIFVIDYLTYQFEEAQISYYPLCQGCDVDSLPFHKIYLPPGDFGDVTFNYTYNNQNLFYGTIWWMGIGEIIYPSNFLTANIFLPSTFSEIPVLKQYFNRSYEDFLENNINDYQLKADTAWNAIAQLQIVEEFVEKDCRVGFYTYAPSVGMFDPNEAKWIIFLYRAVPFTNTIIETNLNDFKISIDENKSLTIFMQSNKVLNGNIYDLTGKKILSFISNSNSKINLSKLKSGMYFLRLEGHEHSIKIMIRE